MKISAAVIATLALGLGIILVNLSGQCHAGRLEVGFYKGKCKSTDVENIVFNVVNERFKTVPNITAALLRLHFHDCFVNGCDASILLDGDSSEKIALPNLSVRGYDVIDEAKKRLEAICEGVVSCADIIAIAARDAVALSGGARYNVETGRRDGKEPGAVVLPSTSFTVPQSWEMFNNKGLTLTDMVLLVGGGHSIGSTHCSFIQDRLYNFQNSGRPDPDMNPELRDELRSRCPRDSSSNAPVNLDQNPLSSSTLDNSIYKQLMLGRGVLTIDQRLALHPWTRRTVAKLAFSKDFPFLFGQAMVNMGKIDVITDESQGEIRKFCNVATSTKPTSTNPTSTNPTSTNPTSTNPTSTNPTSSNPEMRPVINL